MWMEGVKRVPRAANGISYVVGASVHKHVTGGMGERRSRERDRCADVCSSTWTWMRYVVSEAQHVRGTTGR